MLQRRTIRGRLAFGRLAFGRLGALRTLGATLAVALTLVGLAGMPVASAQEVLFEYSGKKYGRADLPTNLKNSLYELESEYHRGVTNIMDSVLIEVHLDQQAKKAGKDRAALEEDIFKVAEPSDAEITAWYEENKSRVPYPLDKIKADIAKLLQGEKQREKREELVAKLKAEGSFKNLLPEPTSPSFVINHDGHPMKGNAKASVTVVEFADYQCPHCRAASEIMKKLVDKHKDKIRFFYLDFPINRSGISTVVAQGAYCVKKQDEAKYWDYHDKAFAEQNSLSNEWPAATAKAMKLNEAEFGKCLDSQEAKDFVAKGKSEGDRIGVSGTPAIFINGERVKGYDEPSLDSAIQAAIKSAAS